MTPITLDITTFDQTLPALLHALGCEQDLRDAPRIVIKPNLINASPPPVTTPLACCRALIEYICSVSQAEIILAEGCGDPDMSTSTVFERLGYRQLAEETGVHLLDLNTAELVRLRNANCPFLPEIYLPRIALESYLISVPVLKAHSLAGITGTLKNMIGLAPPSHYAGRKGSWKKAALHAQVHQAIVDINTYRSPDLSLMDASVGMAEYHLGGPTVDPPLGKLMAGLDPWAVDREAAELLGLDWQDIEHLRVRA